jgi:hypothetical protein
MGEQAGGLEAALLQRLEVPAAISSLAAAGCW